VRGTGPAAVAAATLLGRAGIGALDLSDALDLPELSPDCCVTRDDGESTALAHLVVDLHDTPGRTPAAAHPLVLGRFSGARAVLLTLVGGPCIKCVPPADRPAPADIAGEPLVSLGAPTLGALAATEALRVLLLAPERGRRTTIDIESGQIDTRELAPVAACPACGSDG
jgi:hypothetical protein